MRVELREVSKGLALPATSVSYASGEVAVAVAETEQRPTVLGLIASGRMRPASGVVVVDGKTDAAALRRRVALVDAPDVSDPAPNVTVAGVTAEELMFAGRTANPIAVRRWLDAAGYGHLARVPFGDVSPRERIGLLLELTALREGIEGIVLVSPDRHGGDPRESIDLVEAFAARGLAMLVIVGQAAASLLRIPVSSDVDADADAVIEPAAVPTDDASTGSGTEEDDSREDGIRPSQPLPEAKSPAQTEDHRSPSPSRRRSPDEQEDDPSRSSGTGDDPSTGSGTDEPEAEERA
ncbi:hypothetical protein [Microbacterium candidum]|uniref:ABC transporter ATP-binding protein n=1 Tax=Microbacterium candidum TaxID=3041922 RepID=A0ABT7MUG1_9MICO|nr:hypothetical protein [Microbacterium sp. ASV49]MDL9978089.1 hypothetical protein [Microbacterium sp. ASV49]